MEGTIDWDRSPPLLFTGPVDNGQEARWRDLRPPADRLMEVHFPPATEEELRQVMDAPAIDVHGRRVVVAVFGIENMKPAARRMLRSLIDGGKFVALFTHAPQSVPPGVLSRCAMVRAGSSPPLETELHNMRLADAQGALRIAGMGSGHARRTALTALFQSGVTLAEFLREVLRSCDEAALRRLTEVAAAAQLAAIGGVNAVVHAEHFLSAYDAVFKK